MPEIQSSLTKIRNKFGSRAAAGCESFHGHVEDDGLLGSRLRIVTSLKNVPVHGARARLADFKLPDRNTFYRQCLLFDNHKNALLLLDSIAP
jgi:hypothetical protein